MPYPATGQLGGSQLGAGWLGGYEPTDTSGTQSIVAPVPSWSLQNWPTPKVTGPITGAHIPAHRSWPTPSVGGAINAALLGPNRSFGNPVVTGSIVGATIPSHQHWGSPSVGTVQTVSPGSPIPSHQSWPTGRVANVQTISGANIPSHAAWPTPTISGSPKWVNVVGIVGPRNIPVPGGSTGGGTSGGVTGGVGGVHIFLSGTDRTVPYLSRVEGTCTVASQTLGRWTATFDLFDDTGAFVPQLGQTVLITDEGTRIFAGCITEVRTERLMSTYRDITYHCTALDKSAICDHRVVAGATYPAILADGTPSDVATVILAIVSNYLNGEGILPGPEIVVGAFGNQHSDYSWNFPNVTQAFDQICSSEGLVWWIDDNSILHFSSLTDLPAAPFGLTETSDNWRNLVTTKTTTAYYNKLYAVSNLNVIPGASTGTTGAAGQTESFTFTPGQPGIVTTVNSIGVTVAVGFLCSVAIGSIISMTVNGNEQTTVNFADFAGQTRIDSNDFLWFFFQSGNQLSWTYGPPAGASIVIKYVPWSSSNTSKAQYGTALVPSSGGVPLGTCGSGVYEGVTQVDSINNLDQLNAIAAAELARIGSIPTVVDFETDFPGLKPGQLLHVDVPLSGVANAYLMITQASGTWISGDTLPFGGNFRWKISATSNLDPGNWQKWYERLVGRTNNPLPILQYEEAVFILGAGSALSGGTNLTNPYIVGRTGLLTQLLAAATTGPSDQDLIVTVTDAANSSHLASITIPAGTSPNTLITVTITKQQGLYVFAGDTLNCNASYAVSGPDPSPAAGVTVKLRWAI